MAGGGGTRLRPLSRPERPKPFLPLLGDETLLQATVARLRGPRRRRRPDRRDGRHRPAATRRWSARRLPGVAVVVEPEGRNTAAAIALATARRGPRRRRRDGRPAGRPPHRPEREGVFRDVLRTAATRLATGALRRRTTPLVTLGHPASRTRRPSTATWSRASRRARTSTGLQAYPLRGVRGEAQARADAESWSTQPGVAWNAGMFLWRRRAIRAALERYAPALDRAARADGLASGDLARRLRAAAVALDRLRGDGERGRATGEVVMAAHGRRLERHRDLAGAARGARRGRRRRRRRRGGRARRGRRPDDLVVERADGAVRVVRPRRAVR